MANVKADTREARLKAALRENLKRRKTQARGRGESERDAAETPDSPKRSGE